MVAPIARAEDDARVLLVAQMYKDFAWEVVIAEPEVGDSVNVAPVESLERYLSQDLIGLIIKDRACQEREEGICNIEFALLWDSQDPAVTDVRVTLDPTTELVEMNYASPGGEKVRIVFETMVIPTGEVRISDFRYASGMSLKAQLAL